MKLPERLAGIAASQRDLLTVAQCREAGISPERVATAVRTGRWTNPHRGVYLTRPGRDDWDTRAVAALLACGPRAALSHHSAARSWGFDAQWQGRGTRAGADLIDVLIPWERRVAAPYGVRLHRTRDWSSRVHIHSWPTRTTGAHTVLDLAAATDLDGAVSWVGRALQQEATTEELLREALERRGRHRHAAELREVLDEGGIESGAELRFHRDVGERHGLPPARRQQVVPQAGSRRVDLEYGEQRLYVEIDGRLGHAGWAGQRRDAGKDIKVATGGWMTIRPGWRDAAVVPCETAAAVAQILWTRGWTGRPRACRSRACAVRALLASGPVGDWGQTSA